jgi:hypothetical protein
VDDTPFVNDGADTSLRKAVSLLNKIEAKTGRLNGLDNDPWVFIPDLMMSRPNVEGVVNFTGYYRFDGVDRWGIANSGSWDYTYIKRQVVEDYYLFTLMYHYGETGQELEFAAFESPSPDFPTSMDPSGGTVVSGSLLFNTEQRESFSVRVTNPVNVILPPVAQSTATTKVRSVDSAGDDLMGSRSDSAATTDTGTFSVLAFIKRGLQNWTTLLAKIPTLVSGRIPVDGSGVTQPVSGTIALDATSLAALENISVTFPATQNVNVTNAGLNVSVTNLPAVVDNIYNEADSISFNVGEIKTLLNTTRPVSLESVPSHPVTGPLTDTQLRAASVPVSQATAANLNATVVGSGSFTAAQATASNLKAQAQLLDSAGSLLTYAATGTAGTPGVDVVSIQGVSSGVAVAVSGPVTDTQLRASSIPVSDRGSVGQATVTTFTSTSSLVLMASNSARKLLTVFNEGAGILYLLYGAGTATTANYSVRIGSGDYLEIEKYTGAVTGIFGTTGTARVTEIS